MTKSRGDFEKNKNSQTYDSDNSKIENLLQTYAGCEIMLTNTLSLPCYSKKTEKIVLCGVKYDI